MPHLIESLLEIQESHGYLPESELRALAKRLRCPLYEIESTVSFYPHLRRTAPAPLRIAVCRDLSCHLRGAEALARSLAERLGDRDGVEVSRVSCLGLCDLAPACHVNDRPASARAALEAVGTGAPADDPEVPPELRAFGCDPYAGRSARPAVGPPRLGPFGILRAALGRDRWDPDDSVGEGSVLASLERSGLRGMGGAGFPAASKWRLVREAVGSPKYVVCNADESEPGTFKDRVILEDLPHLVIEGMLLAGRFVGAREGIVYIRHEYARARARLAEAIDSAYAAGALGGDVLGSGWSFDLRIFVSPGGYILGEETALLEALEGRRGEPRNKPPFPGVRGLWGRPTLIHNVETLALVPRAVHTGSADLKFFAVSGDVARPGVYEVPLGTTLAELLERCGGVSEAGELLAFLPGGASTGFLPASEIERPLDWESLRRAGSALGSGAVVVVRQGRDLRSIARNLTEFFRNESCGKCVPCRIGTQKAVELLGSGAPADLERLPALHETLAQTSICGLGQAALIPAISVIERLRDGRAARERTGLVPADPEAAG